MANGSGKVGHSHKGVLSGGRETELSKKEVGPHSHKTKADHFHYNTKTGRWIAHEKFDHGQGPEGRLGRIIGHLKDRAGLAEKTKEGREAAGRPKFESGAKESQKIADKLKIQPQKIREQLQRSEQKGRTELTPFERVLLARFVESQPLGSLLRPGECHLPQKSEGEWKAFFQKFIPFTLEKKASPTALREAIFRGLMKGETGRSMTPAEARQAQQIALLISDLKFSSGKTEKFARIPLEGRQFAQLLVKLASLAPGDQLSQALLLEGLGGGEFAYLALSHKIVRPDLARAMDNALVASAQARGEEAFPSGREVTRGIALNAKTEELVARQLDIDLRRAIPQAVSDKAASEGELSDRIGRRGFGGFLRRRRRGEGEEPILEEGFVPWYRLIFERRKWKGRPRWYIPLLYFTAASATALFAVYVFKFLLQR